MSETKSTPSLESTLKSLDTEEFIDIHFYRPIGYQWALFFNKLGVSPNSITIASIFIGIAAGICFYFQSLAINVIGMLLLIWANNEMIFVRRYNGNISTLEEYNFPMGVPEER